MTASLQAQNVILTQNLDAGEAQLDAAKARAERAEEMNAVIPTQRRQSQEARFEDAAKIAEDAARVCRLEIHMEEMRTLADRVRAML
ncbi:hypothetical protein HKX48_002046 [Thoreauomyces humboldtii]|nr:hypothetical protein HKX48_002046 [Thoreauomyces humboldtii]